MLPLPAGSHATPHGPIPALQLRPRAGWAVIGLVALLALLLGSCPEGASAGVNTPEGAPWPFLCPITRASASLR